MILTKLGVFHDECHALHPASYGPAKTPPENFDSFQTCRHCGDLVFVPLNEAGIESFANAPGRIITQARRWYDIPWKRCTRCGNVFREARCPCRRAQDLPPYSFRHDCIKRG